MNPESKIEGERAPMPRSRYRAPWDPPRRPAKPAARHRRGADGVDLVEEPAAFYDDDEGLATD